MSSLLRLAAETLDRMTNPAFGVGVNEAYGQRLARMWDEEFQTRLRQEAAVLRDPDELTPHGWMWLLEWAPRLRLELHSGLLLELCERWHVASMQAAVIAHVVRTRDPWEWLADLVRRATTDEHDPEADARHTRHAESLLVALLQVGEPPTLSAAGQLLATPSSHQDRLVDFYTGWLDSLEPEVRGTWEQVVPRPPRPPQPDL